MYEEQISILQQRLVKQPGNIKNYEWLGTAFILSGNQDAGKESWEKIIDLQPNNFDRYKTVANLYYRNGFLDDAESTYKTARTIKGDPTLFARELAGVYELQMNYSQAIDEYLNHLKTDNKLFNYVSGKVIKLCEKEKIWDAAIVKIQDAIASTMDNFQLHKLLGDIYLRSGKSDLGLNEYLLYEEKSSTAGRAVFEYAQRCEEEGDYPVAILAYNDVINREPQSDYRKKAILNKAKVLSALSQYQEALQTYEILISLRRKDNYTSQAYLGIGDIYLFQLNQPDKALEAYQNLIENSPRGQYASTAHFRIAELHFIQDQPDKAREEYQKIDKVSNVQEIKEKALYQLAYIEFLEGNIDETGKLFSTMLKEYPDGQYVNDALRWSIFIEKNQQEDLFAAYIQGLKHQRQMKHQHALSDFQQLISTDSTSILADDAYFQIAELYVQIGDHSKAVETYRDLAVRYPGSDLLAEAQIQIGDIYSNQLKDYILAKDAYEKVILNYPESIQADLVRKKLQKLSGKLD